MSTSPTSAAVPVVLHSAEEIARRVQALGQQIGADYAKSETLTLLGLLKGGFIFLADLCRAIPRPSGLPLAIEFMGLQSYGGQKESSGVVEFTLDLKHPIAGKDVLVVEDIVDSGLTLDYLLRSLRLRNPASIRVATLLDKKDRRKKAIAVDYVGFTIPDVFVVGYGLDYAERYRNLPFVGMIESVVG